MAPSFMLYAISRARHGRVLGLTSPFESLEWSMSSMFDIPWGVRDRVTMRMSESGQVDASKPGSKDPPFEVSTARQPSRVGEESHT
jgi:hypothetical protein